MTLPLNSRLSALYDTNGTQKDFSFGFRVFFDPDNGGYGLEVRRQTADGYEIIPKSDYLVLPVEDNSAGIVRFSIAPSAGQQIYIAGKTPTIQQLVLTNFGRYSAESIETQFDFITAIIQEWLSALGEETRQRMAADDILTQYVVQRIDEFVQQVNQNWDDKSQEIEDYIATIMPSFTQALRDEIEAFAVAGMQDAIDQTLAESKAEIDDAVARANAAALAAAITGKLYDTPEAGVNPVTGVADGAYFNVRSSSDESYVDEYQNVSGSAVATGKSYPSSNAKWGASSVVDASGKNQQELNNLFLKGVPSYATLKTLKPLFAGQQAELVSYVEGHRLGGGTFEAVQGNHTDDGGYTCKVNNEWAWKRCTNNATVYVTEFGLVNGGELDVPLDNAIKFCHANGRPHLVIPTTGKTNYTFNGGLSYNLNGTPLTIEGQSYGKSGQAIHHTGTNIGLTFRSFADLWCPVKMRRLRVRGSANGIAFFRVSDSWNNHFDASVVTGYTNGSIGEIYNEANWTEGFNSHNVMARDCKNGFFFHRNPLENPSSVYPDKHATDSFYRTIIKNLNFQHGVGSASSAIVIGSYAAENNGFDSCNMYSSELDIGGWFEAGGDSSGINIANGSRISLSKTEFFYDGAAALNLSSPPTRLFRLGANAKVASCSVLRNDMQNAITSIQNYLNVGGVTDIYPFRSVAHKVNEFESENGVDTFDATVSQIKFQFSLSAGEAATIRLLRLFKASEYRIKLTKNDAGSDVYRYHSQGVTHVGYLVCETLHPKITTTMSGSAAPYIATSVASLPDGTQSGAVVRLLNNLAQGAYSIDYFLGCEVYVPAVSANSTFTVTLEKI